METLGILIIILVIGSIFVKNIFPKYGEIDTETDIYLKVRTEDGKTSVKKIKKGKGYNVDKVAGNKGKYMTLPDGSKGQIVDYEVIKKEPGATLDHRGTKGLWKKHK